MDITLPTIPAGVTVLLGLLAPYLIGLLNGILSFIEKPWQKRTLSVVVSVVLAAVALAFYYLYTGDAVPEWPQLVLLTVVVVQFSYALITKPTAAAIERRYTPGSSLRRDLR
ncbi:hypothetical protein G3H63_15590 [Microbacterium resistens]|uniref:hypothetical protein n=1 Tax=Microbacterium resistens TaxID=156977 RepID=UPI001C56C6F6|nr:hypothetical protein [Microbacterium resistens]MBW1640487.1 hypothetical protein [Microbacterium resistens]